MHGTYSSTRHVSSRIVTSKHPLKLVRRLNGQLRVGTGTAALAVQDESDTDDGEGESHQQQQQQHDENNTDERPRKKHKKDAATATATATTPAAVAMKALPHALQRGLQPGLKTHWKLVCFVGPFSKGSSLPFETEWKREARKDIGRLAWAVINARRCESNLDQPVDVFVDMHYRELLAKQLAKTASGRSFIQKYTEASGNSSSSSADSQDE